MLKIPLNDTVALVIAKVREIRLLTGGWSLQKDAVKEDAEIIGTLGIFDRLYQEHLIELNEYFCCIKELLRYNGGKVRLPEAELRQRISSLRQSVDE